jgi:hypothetical protein
VWSKAEETTFLKFLLQAVPSSGDGGFKLAGFTWSDEHGAGISDRKDDVWACFTKVSHRNRLHACPSTDIVFSHILMQSPS